MLAAVTTTVVVDVQLLSLISGLIVPVLTRIATTRLASGTLQLAVLTLLASVAGLLSSLIAAGGLFQLRPTVLALLTTWATAFGAHYAGQASGVLPAVGRITANVGVGPREPAPPAPDPEADHVAS